MDNNSQEQPGSEPKGETPERRQLGPTPPRLGPGPAAIILPVTWCTVVSGVGLLGLGAAPVFLAVAIYAAWKRTALAFILVGLVGIGVSVTLGNPVGVAFTILTSASGLILGAGIARHWTYGRTVAATTAALFCVNALFMAYSWESIGESTKRYLSVVRAQMGIQAEKAVPDNAPAAEEQKQPQEQPPQAAEPNRSILEFYEWMLPRWPNFLVGSLFAMILAGVYIALSGTSWWLRKRSGLIGTRGSFLTTHTPDWLVWFVILTAALWFADRRWAGTIMRPISWNMAVALAGVYWLNGVSIVMYAMKALQVAPALVGLVAAGVVCFGVHPIALIGLFDTWVGFRARVDILVELKNKRDQSGGGDIQ